MKVVDPLCRQCTKSCKQIKPAVVVSCAKFIQSHLNLNTEKQTKIVG